jgi:glycosyltransferase involved in cell wall biosynthesis
MHVVLLSHEYPPFLFGGIGTSTRDLAQGLSRKGVKITIISGYPVSFPAIKNDCVREQDENGISILRFSYPNIPPRHTIFQLANSKNIYNSTRKENPDIIHGQSGSTFPASIGLKNIAPLLVTYHTSPRMQKMISTYSILRGGSISDFMTFVLGYPAWSYSFRKELDVSQTSVAVSRTLRHDLLNEMGESYSNKLRTIHNGIDIEKLTIDYNNAGQDAEMSNKTILFAGRLFWGKGVMRLLEFSRVLQREMPDYKIIVHGKGPLLNVMSKKITELKLSNIELKGFANRQQLMKSMRRSSFIIIPSYYEACPMLLLEGMCLGKIPLMYRYEYALEFTENGTYGVIASDSEDMTVKLKQLCNKGNLNKFSNEIRYFAQRNYSIDHVAENYYQLYKEICA